MSILQKSMDTKMYIHVRYIGIQASIGSGVTSFN